MNIMHNNITAAERMNFEFIEKNRILVNEFYNMVARL